MAALDPDGWIPIRWPCGPLEIERGRRREGFSARETETLRRWSEPRALELLAGTRVNCLVLPWAEGSREDDAHQRALAPLVTAARGRGLSLVGWAGDDADLGRAASAAHAAGLDALATSSTHAAPGVDLLRFRPRGGADRSAAGFFGVADAVWPGLKATQDTDVDAWSGPTGPPWIDSNAWYVRLAGTLASARTVWLSFDPPEGPRPPTSASYVQAVADSEIYGGHWLVSLDSHLRSGLAEGQACARETWTGIARALAFFAEHRAWRDYQPVGSLGVLSDYAGANEFLSFEVLNLLARQSSPYRVLEKTRAEEEPLDGLSAVLYVDETPPGRSLLRKLYAFAEAGGTLITPPGWEERGALDADAWLPRFRVFRYGGGRVAVSGEELADPQRLAEDAQLLTSHRHDPVRVFNSGTAVSHYATSGDGATGVLHLLRFGMPYEEMPVTAWFRRRWSSARAWRVDSTAAEPTPRAVVDSGVEFHLPPVPVYCGLEVAA